MGARRAWGRGLRRAPGSPGRARDSFVTVHTPREPELIARHPCGRGAVLEPWQEAPAANPLHTSAGSRAKAAAARRHPMPALLAELPDSTQASPWLLELFPFKLKVVVVSQICEVVIMLQHPHLKQF